MKLTHLIPDRLRSIEIICRKNDTEDMTVSNWRTSGVDTIRHHTRMILFDRADVELGNV
jgi:hypothetical protein